jgi:hypothetical protein
MMPTSGATGGYSGRPAPAGDAVPRPARRWRTWELAMVARAPRSYAAALMSRTGARRAVSHVCERLAEPSTVESPGGAGGTLDGTSVFWRLPNRIPWSRGPIETTLCVRVIEGAVPGVETRFGPAILPSRNWSTYACPAYSNAIPLSLDRHANHRFCSRAFNACSAISSSRAQIFGWAEQDASDALGVGPAAPPRASRLRAPTGSVRAW